MLHQRSHTLGQIGALSAACFLLLLAVAQSGESQESPLQAGPSFASQPATDAASNGAAREDSYVGTNQCFTCHRPQTNTWSETDHVNAFTDLPSQYRGAPECLKCHVTGYGEAGGYVAGAEKDLLMVGCEACHGPGARHVEAAQRFILADPGEEEKIEKEIRETITKTPSDNVCFACHIMQAHQEHPTYGGELPTPSESDSGARCGAVARGPHPSSARTLSGPGTSLKYSVKTCGGCHYDQYQDWQREAHSDLAKMLPAQYLSDDDCQKCHLPAGTTAVHVEAVDEPHHRWIGVGCESCHGPALEHVRFTKRFISSPPLGPKLEKAARNSISKGKSPTTCVECHIHERHAEHPAVEKTEP